jgi:hypothetical protein
VHRRSFADSGWAGRARPVHQALRRIKSVFSQQLLTCDMGKLQVDRELTPRRCIRAGKEAPACGALDPVELGDEHHGVAGDLAAVQRVHLEQLG